MCVCETAASSDRQFVVVTGWGQRESAESGRTKNLQYRTFNNVLMSGNEWSHF